MQQQLEAGEDALALCKSALCECEARYQTIVEHAPEAIVVLDADAGRFVAANRNAALLFDMPRAALLDSDPVALSPPTQPGGAASRELARDRIEEALAGGAPTFEWMHRTPAGADLRCEVHLVRLPAAGRRLVRGSVTDVTRQRRLEEQLRQWQKLEALGQLAGGVAHDLNSILLAISASADTLAEDLPEGARLEAEWIRSAVVRGTGLTQRLLAFLRREEPRPVRLDLNAVVGDAAELLSRLLPSRVELLTRLEPGSFVRGDRHELEQVLINLVLNARDAMPQGGRITASTRQLPARVIRLRVEDTGMGMDDATRERMFEAFFTTKPEGKGSGLGLSIVQGIVRRAGGWLEVSSQPGRGTSVDLFLPCADRDA
jgi:PAS domain S-box-containing protein